MEFSIDIHTALTGKIIVEDFSKEYGQYLDEDAEVVYSYDEFKYSETASLNAIIKVNTDKIKFSYEDCILVPYETVSGNGILKCLVVDKIVIDNKHVIIKPLIGLSNQMFKIEGINMLLNSQTLEGEI